MTLVVIAAISAAASARPLRVRSETELTLDAQVDGGRVTFYGGVSETPAGQGLGGHTVWLTLRSDEGEDELALLTDDGGRFSHPIVLSDGDWFAAAAFDGDVLRDPSAAELSLEVLRPEAEMDLAVPALLRRQDHAIAEVRLRVVDPARGLPVAQAQVALDGSCVAGDGVLTTNSLGVGLGEIYLITAGTCVLTATLVDDGRFRPTEASIEVRIAEDPIAALLVDEVRGRWIGTGRWQVTPHLTDDGAVIDGVPVEVRVAEVEGETLETLEGVSGESLRISPRSYGVADVEVHVEVPMGLEVLRSAPVQLSSANALARRLPWFGLALLVAVLSVFAALSLIAWWRDRPRRVPRRASTPAMARSARPSRAEGSGLGGRVLDAHTAEPVGGAVVTLQWGAMTRTLQADEAGRFECAELFERGDVARADLTFSAPSYLRWETRVHRPKPGEYLTVHLTSIQTEVRQRIEAAFAGVTRAELRPQWWGSVTVMTATQRVSRAWRRLRHVRPPDPVAQRELQRQLADAAATADPATAAETLGLLLDDVAFGPRAYPEAILTQVDALVDQLKEARRG